VIERRNQEEGGKPVVRLLLFLLGLLTANRPAQRDLAWQRAGAWYDRDPAGPGGALGLTASAGPAAPASAQPSAGAATGPAAGPGGGWPGQPDPPSARLHEPARTAPQQQPQPGGPVPRRRRVPRWAAWTALIAAGLVFRKAIAYLALLALSAALHLVGVSVHLPSIRFPWPWQSGPAVVRTTTTNTDLGPWVLQKIEGISRPALGQVNFNFLFTHKVSKSIGIWPCWYASTFYAVGHASATVDLNPGPSWWAPATGHYRLQVLSRPAAGKPGSVRVTMVLPPPQLPQSVHDVTIDDIPSKPIATQHSWTYPGFGCGVLLRPQFTDSVLYAQAQQLAFYKSTHVPQITTPLISAAETEATQTIRDNFVQPTLNAFGYTLEAFTITWAKVS
jgi:hypothetical protein